MRGSQVNIEIKGMIESSFLDWDGKIVSTLYVPHCNFRCPFCHNWELVMHPEKFDTKPFDEIKSFLTENRDFIDGICLTGGEPALYSDLVEYSRKIKDLGMMMKLDTNGSVSKMIEKVFDRELIDYIAMDIKAPLEQKAYNRLAGVKVNLENIKKTIQLIMSSGVDYEFRTTVIPTLLNSDDILDIARSIEGAKKYVLQQFVAEHTFSKQLRSIKPYNKEKIEAMIRAGSKHVEKMFARGLK